MPRRLGRNATYRRPKSYAWHAIGLLLAIPIIHALYYGFHGSLAGRQIVIKPARAGQTEQLISLLCVRERLSSEPLLIVREPNF